MGLRCGRCRAPLYLRRQPRRPMGHDGPLVRTTTDSWLVSKLFVFVRRAPGVAPSRLWETWGAVIRELLAQGPGRRVRRAVENRAIADANVPELTLSRYDGAYELWFDGMADLQAALGDHAWR